jgi:hypothetical protein
MVNFQQKEIGKVSQQIQFFMKNQALADYADS